MIELLYKDNNHVKLRIAGQVHQVKTLDLLAFTKALTDLTKLPDGPRGLKVGLKATPPINLRKA